MSEVPRRLVRLHRGRRLRIAAGAVAAMGATALVAHRDVAAWWIMVVSVIAVLIGSVRRGAR